jgi:hypothetical protein
MTDYVPPRIVKFMFWLACVLLYAWPALANGGGIFFPDTTNYIRAADAAVVSLTGHSSQWSDRLVAKPLDKPSESNPAAKAPTASPSANPASASASALQPTRTVLNGRSIYYGALLYVGLEGFGRYGPVFIHSAIAVTALALILMAIPAVDQRRRWLWIAGGLLALGALSPLPFFLTRLMPGAFTGIGVAALVSLLLFWDHHSRFSRVFLIALVAASATFHTTHLALTLVVACGAIILNLGRKEGWKLHLALPAMIIGTAAIAQMIFAAAVIMSIHTPPISPPFLSARVIADGPGRDYLKTHCTQPRFILCDYVGRMGDGSDTMLWSENTADGIFSAVPQPIQRKLAAQDTAFYFAVVKDRPMAVLQSSLTSAGEQFTHFDLDHFNYGPEFLGRAKSQLPAQTYDWVSKTAAFTGGVPIRMTIIATIAITIITLYLLGVTTISAIAKRARPSPIVCVCLLFLLVVVANGFICGAFSTPHARYQMRLIWLLPLGVIMLGISGFSLRDMCQLNLNRRQNHNSQQGTSAA